MFVSLKPLFFWNLFNTLFLLFRPFGMHTHFLSISFFFLLVERFNSFFFLRPPLPGLTTFLLIYLWLFPSVIYSLGFTKSFFFGFSVAFNHLLYLPKYTVRGKVLDSVITLIVFPVFNRVIFRYFLFSFRFAIFTFGYPI